jgi:hypothetical protein
MLRESVCVAVRAPATGADSLSIADTRRREKRREKKSSLEPATLASTRVDAGGPDHAVSYGEKGAGRVDGEGQEERAAAAGMQGRQTTAAAGEAVGVVRGRRGRNVRLRLPARTRGVGTWKTSPARSWAGTTCCSHRRMARPGSAARN